MAGDLIVWAVAASITLCMVVFTGMVTLGALDMMMDTVASVKNKVVAFFGKNS